MESEKFAQKEHNRVYPLCRCCLQFCRCISRMPSRTGFFLRTIAFLLVQVELQFGSVSYRMSLTLGDNDSGNLMSNETMRSPFRLGSLGNGRPWPWIRFTVVGFTTSLVRLMGIFSPVNVGTSIIVPQRACNKQNVG